MSPRIEHVSDTALMVAGARAWESEHPDGLIHDPFAARLAGERGAAIFLQVARPDWVALGMGLRTRLLDDLLALCLNRGTESVLSLGAGLDARPWRLNLPAGLRWTEVDFPAMLDYKYDLLRDTPPHCRLDRRSADLTNQAQRRQVIEEAAAGAANPLLITEGLLMYLPGEVIEAMAAEARQAGYRYWILNTTTRSAMQLVHGQTFDDIAKVRAENHLEDRQIREVLEARGWKTSERRLFVEEAPKLAAHRIPKDAPRPDASDPSGLWLFECDGL